MNKIYYAELRCILLTSLEVPGKNFEFVAVKEEVIDEFLEDEHCLQLEHGDKLR
jgi:hypothetical protein